MRVAHNRNTLPARDVRMLDFATTADALGPMLYQVTTTQNPKYTRITTATTHPKPYRTYIYRSTRESKLGEREKKGKEKKWQQKKKTVDRLGWTTSVGWKWARATSNT